jgi:hypothetical protein
MSSNVVPYERAEEVAEVAGLFEAANPGAVVRKAAEAASELAAVIEDKKLFTPIGGRKHIRIEGWTLLGSMLGVFPYVVWSRPIDDEGMDGGWEARVEVRTRDGQVIGAAEAECMRSEKRWRDADDYAVRSMAQTRAASKALKMPLGFVFAMAGYETTPAEEMPAVVEQPPRPRPAPASDAVGEGQRDEIFRLLDELQQLDPGTDWAAWCREYAGVPFNKMDKIGADRLIAGLMEKVDQFGPPPSSEGSE